MTEADLVADYLAKGGTVTTLPTGATTLEQQYRWCPEYRGLVGQDKALTEKLRNVRMGRRAPTRTGTTPAVQQRRAKLASLIQDGKRTAECAQILGVSEGTVAKDAYHLGMRFSDFDRTTSPVLERRQIVERLAMQGKTAPAIAEAVGTTEATVRDDLKALGLRLLDIRATLAMENAA
jgi:DNA-binding NarL/FixJ family response regulator